MAVATVMQIRDRLIAQRVVPVLRLPSAELLERAVECVTQAGFATVEITMTTPRAIGAIERLACRFGPSLLIGAGTVLDLDTARQAMDAGARFLVSPCAVAGMAEVAHAAGCAALLGGLTPSEVLSAHRAGADIIKVFPASTGGPEHVRAIHAVFPDIPLCPTGGVSLENMAAFFAAGAALVGVGNNILDTQALAAGDLARAIAHARRFLGAVALAA